MDVTVEINTTIEATVEINAGALVCSDATVTNSDATYSQTVASGATLVLPDTTVDIYIDGVLNQSTSIVTLGTSEEINISL